MPDGVGADGSAFFCSLSVSGALVVLLPISSCSLLRSLPCSSEAAPQSAHGPLLPLPPALVWSWTVAGLLSRSTEVRGRLPSKARGLVHVGRDSSAAAEALSVRLSVGSETKPRSGTDRSSDLDDDPGQGRDEGGGRDEWEVWDGREGREEKDEGGERNRRDQLSRSGKARDPLGTWDAVMVPEKLEMVLNWVEVDERGRSG